MQEYFPGFYSLACGNFGDLLDKATIVLDADVLLDLFRLRKEDAKCFLAYLEVEPIKNKLWIPYDVAWLYHKRMNEEILKQIDNINSVLSHLTQCKTSIHTARNFPYLEGDLSEKLQDIIDKVAENCQIECKSLLDNLKSGEIKDKINMLFQGKIGEAYSEEQLATIYESGKERYRNLEPPGCDTEKCADERIYYHDLIIWKQILNYSKTSICKGHGILLVTGKIKRGWYYLVNNEIISTRHELINEFMKEVQEGRESDIFFQCLSSSQFVKDVYSKYQIIHPRYANLKKQLQEKVEYASLNSNGIINNQTVNSYINNE